MPTAPLLRSDPGCPVINLSPARLPIVGHLTFHELISYLGTTCAALALLISFGNILSHAFTCYRVTEQKHVMRIQWVVGAFAISYTVAVLDYSAEQYLVTIPEIVEAFCFTQLFQLFVEQASGTADWNEQEAYFATLERRKRKKSPVVVKHRRGSLRWYRALSIGIYQFPVVKFLWTPVYIVLTDLFCTVGTGGKAVHTANSLVNFCTTAAALMSVISLYLRLRIDLKPRHAVRKAVVFKQLIGVVFVQSFTVSFVIAGQVIHPSAKMSYGDYTVGIISFMTQCEMLIFAIAFAFCFNAREYKQMARKEGTTNMALMEAHAAGPAGKVSAMRTLLAMLNLTDYFAALGRSARNLASINSHNAYSPRNPRPRKELSPSSSLNAAAYDSDTPFATPLSHASPFSESEPTYAPDNGVTAPSPALRPPSNAQRPRF